MDKILFTENYENCKTGNLVSISGDKGKKVGYAGNTYKAFAPKLGFWMTWHDNLGTWSKEKSDYFYIEHYYDEVLSKLDPMDVMEELGNMPILLCYEDNMDFCHRHLVAFWLELMLGIKTYEIKMNDKLATLEVLSRPEYLKNILEDVIRNKTNLNGYSSISAAYYYNKSEYLSNKFLDDMCEHKRIDDSDCKKLDYADSLKNKAKLIESTYVHDKQKQHIRK